MLLPISILPSKVVDINIVVTESTQELESCKAYSNLNSYAT
jgi:hypothetical protein